MERQGMNSELEAEGRVKALPYKVRAASKESQAQRASQILDSDLRTHWSSSTNTKEWILLELEETCLLSHIRIHNKSVLEWEISIGLRNKPDTFLKVRPRCEAPRRDIIYNIGHLPCRYVRISCLRGNPIAIFFVQLMGISVPGLEPELQPVVDHFLPQIISRIKDPHDIQLQLLQDISIRLSPFLQQLEGELSVPNEAMDSTIRFLAMLVGPFYSFLALFKAVRDSEKLAASGVADEEFGKGSLASVFTVSSNFQAPPKRIRSPGLSLQTTGQSLALRPNSVILLLKVAYKDVYLSTVCRKGNVGTSEAKVYTACMSRGLTGIHVGRLLRKLSLLNSESAPAVTEASGPGGDDSTAVNDTPPMRPADYSKLFGEDFRVPDDDSLDIGSASMMDIPLVEEALLHVLFACATQPLISRRLADAKSDLSPVLPLLRSLLPALRPPSSTAPTADVVDESFWQWQAPLVQRALIQVVALATAPSYRPLLDACSGYLSTYSPAHEKSACVLIDLCAGPLAPWLNVIIAKVDLAIELLENLLGIIQAGHQAPAQARAVLVYLMLALSGHVDDVLPQYKKVKHKVLFVIEMLEPYLIPAIMPVKSTIAFGDVSAVVLEKHEKTCALALELLHTALQKPSILPSMEAEWRRGHVAPSVLLSILAPHVALPPGIDQRKCVTDKRGAVEASPVPDAQTVITFGTTAEEASWTTPAAEGASKLESNEDAGLLFAPLELKGLTLLSLSSQNEGTLTEGKAFLDMLTRMEGKSGKKLLFDVRSSEHEWDIQTEYWQLVNTPERELRASEFIRFASELHTRQDESTESQQSAIGALLLAAECHVNPLFMISSNEYQKLINKTEGEFSGKTQKAASASKEAPGLDMLAWLEEERDKAVLHILMRAAEWDSLGAVDGESANQEGDDGYGELDGCACDIEIDEEDRKVEDAVTLVRQRQGLLCQFLIRQLQRDRHNLYEVLLQGLLFVLHSATQLASPPEDVIDVILGCATRLNASLVVYHNQGTEGILSQGPGTFHSVRRQWVLLRKLVLVASAGRLPGDESGRLHQDLIPGWAWMSKIPQFAASSFPLVRYVGWMGVAQFARFHSQIGVPLISNIHDLTSLLLIFSDELVSIELLKYKESGEDSAVIKAALEAAHGVLTDQPEQHEQADPGNLVKVLYPEFAPVFPRLRVEFSHFADTLLQSICARIEAVPRSFIPDMLSWFSEVCHQPFPGRYQGEKQVLGMKGFTVSNARYVIMRLLEVIILEHMEAILPELSRVFQVLISLCSSTYCDVPLLEAVLKALKPIISHATSSAAAASEGDSSIEALSYETLMQQLSKALDKTEQGRDSGGVESALCLFLCGFLLSTLSTSRRNKLLSTLKTWVESTNFGLNESNSLLDTLSAFHKILDECLSLLQEMAGEGDAHPTEMDHVNSTTQGLHALLDDANPPGLGTPESEVSVGDSSEAILGEEGQVVAANGAIDAKEVVERLEASESEEKGSVQPPSHGKTFSDKLEFRSRVQELVLALGPVLETSRKLHPQLTLRVTQAAARCLHYAGNSKDAEGVEGQSFAPCVKSLALCILSLQKGHCWQVASTGMEYLLSLPARSEVYREVCKILEYQCTHAPRVAWRLQPTQWLPKAFPVESLTGASEPLIQLLCAMLEHPEPEQHAGALRQLEKLVDDEENNVKFARAEHEVEGGEPKTAVEVLVSAMWVPVVTAATTEVSAGLRKQALKVLTKMVPFAEPTQVQSLLSSIDMVLKTGPALTQLGLSLLAQACLYSNASDLDIIPSRVWNSIEALAQSKPGGKFVEMEREICQALLQLRDEGEAAKQHTREVLSSPPEKLEPSPSFAPVREAVVEVLARLSVLRSKTDISISTAVQEAAELEEAEIELELVREEQAARRGDGESRSSAVVATSVAGASSGSEKDRLKQLRAQILAEERLAARAEVAARRQKQRVARRNRQLALEEATLREMALLQELEKERAAEAERDIERQRTLERERAKTREMRHNLDLEAERRSQKEYQRELEQRETGVVRTASRREFASNTTPSSRPRERYRERERELQRAGQEGLSRPNSEAGGRESATTPPATPTASASHSGLVAAAPTASAAAAATSVGPRIYSGGHYSLAAGFGRDGPRDRDRDRDRDRSDERGYDDEGAGIGNGGAASRVDTAGEGGGAFNDDGASGMDGGGGGAFNDDGASGMDGGGAGAIASSHRQGPRSSRPRQIVERRERDGRREGKWERKQT